MISHEKRHGITAFGGTEGSRTPVQNIARIKNSYTIVTLTAVAAYDNVPM